MTNKENREKEKMRGKVKRIKKRKVREKEHEETLSAMIMRDIIC